MLEGVAHALRSVRIGERRFIIDETAREREMPPLCGRLLVIPLMVPRHSESMSARTVFVLGGARSGKSAYAERRAAETGRAVRYVATAVSPGQAGTPADAEFAQRIAIHRERRPAHWRTVESGADLAAAIRDAGDDCLIVDCLTLWLTGLFYSPTATADLDGGNLTQGGNAVKGSDAIEESDAIEAGGRSPNGETIEATEGQVASPSWIRHVDAFEAALAQARAPVFIVSNEIGLGVVPMGAETRRFVDELGRLNQRIAARCDEVIMMVAGLPMQIKP